MRLISAVNAILVACIPSAFALPTKHDTSNEVTEEGMPPVRSLDETHANIIDTLAVETDGSVSSSEKTQTFQVVDVNNDELTISSTDILTKKDKTSKAPKFTKGTKQPKFGTKMPKSSKCMIKMPKMPKGATLPPGESDYAYMRISLKDGDNCSEIQSFFEDNLCMAFKLLECRSVSASVENSSELSRNLDAADVSFKSWSVIIQIFDTAAQSLSKKEKKKIEKKLKKLWKKEQEIDIDTLLSIDDIFSIMIPSAQPSSGSTSPSLLPSFQPSNAPSKVPSDIPSDVPSQKPSDVPSDQPSSLPSLMPSDIPSDSPSDQPSSLPSSMPSDIPSYSPSDQPSSLPSSMPSDIPSDSPSDKPSSLPSSMPSDIPSDSPSDQPSSLPSSMPSDIPSDSPSDQSSSLPSSMPSDIPSDSPSDQPSSLPSSMPSDIPSYSPSDQLSSLQFSTSFEHACALYSTEVKCIGSNYNGQRGLYSGDLNYPNTLSVSSSSSTIEKVVTGAYFTCTLMKDGTVYCNGLNNLGQLGDGTNISSPSPVQVKKDVNALTGVTDLSEAYHHICAIYGMDDKIYCWGFNIYGQLAWNGTTGVKTIVATYYSTCLVKKSNPSKVECKGSTSINVNWNDKTFDMGQTITKLTAGRYHVCALLEDRTAKCFGDNSDGQLGNGSRTNNYDSASDAMQDLTTTLQGITDINAGADSTCLVVADSKPMCFGRNTNYQLGIANGGDDDDDYSGADVKYPTELDVTFPDGVDVVSVHVNYYNGYAVMSDNSVYSWGIALYGGLGQGDVTIDGYYVGDTDEESAVEVAFGEWGS